MEGLGCKAGVVLQAETDAAGRGEQKLSRLMGEVGLELDVSKCQNQNIDNTRYRKTDQKA